MELEQKKGRDNPDLASMLNILAVIHRYLYASEYDIIVGIFCILMLI